MKTTLEPHAVAGQAGASGVLPAVRGRWGTFNDYVELSKPEVTTLILITAGMGYCLGARPGQFHAATLLHVLLGTMLAAIGTAALNQVWERDSDARMRRTQRRPLPAGRMASGWAIAFGAGSVAAGTAYLALTTNLLASFLAFFTFATYLFLYTPLKRRSTACTTIGAFPGAIPPLIGWAAAAGSLGPGAWVLAAILFLWQFPHFMAIAWLYRDDYARAGIVMLPVVEPDGASTARQIGFCLAALVPVSAVPALLGMAGVWYLLAAILLAAGFAYYALRLIRSKALGDARRLLRASVIYLPLLYTALLLDRR